MRNAVAALLGMAATGLIVVPASAQGLNDVGRLLQDQVLGNRPAQNPDAERQAYEQGRRDQEEQRRRERADRRPSDRDRDRDRANDDRRRLDQNDRQRADDAQRRERDLDRQRIDQQRSYNDDQRARGRY